MQSKKITFSSELENGSIANAKGSQNISANEAFRSIKRSLLTAAFEQGEDHPIRNRILVTSINGQEGKTFVSFGLAKSIANELDKTVLLVDADVLSPKISESILVENAEQDTDSVDDIGLINYLSDHSIDVSNVIYHTDRERLKLLPMGKSHQFANELLSSGRMNDLMCDFNARYSDRLVIFDAPALFEANETLALANQVDQIVVVIEEGVTRTIDIQTVNLELSQLGIPVHYILNKTLHKPKWLSLRSNDRK